MNRFLQMTLVSLLVAGSLLLTGCNEAQSSETPTDAKPAGVAPSATSATRGGARAAVQPAPVCNTCGVVKSIRHISRRPEGSGLGAAVGAVVGGLAGSQIGGGTGKSLATVAGVVGGAVTGNNIERNRNAEQYYEIDVAMDNGGYKTMTLPNASGLSVGSPVVVDAGTLHLR